MSREIKFRAWVKPLERYCRIQELRYGADGVLCEVVVEAPEEDSWRHARLTVDADDVILEQDTGFKDKNGKEIYEGDIVKIQGAGKRPKTYRIGWFALIAGFIATRHGIKAEEYLMEFCRVMSGEVIGNIHENPELLEDS